MSEDMTTEAPVDASPAVDTSVESPAVEATQPDVATGVAAETTEATQESPPPSVWNAFQSLPDFQGVEEREIAQRLYQSFEREKAASKALSQYQQLIPYAQEYERHREPFERWMQEQQAAPQQQQQQVQQAAPAEEAWWNPPEIKDSDRQYLTRDENGREVISEDAPLHVRERLYEFQRYKSEFAQRFLANPEEALGPMVEQIAQQKADQLIQDRLSEQQETSYISDLETQNRDWLYDKQGNPTKEGLAVQRYIGQASEMGIATAEQKWAYATAMVERDLLTTLREQQARQQSQQAFQQSLPAEANVAPEQQEVSTNQAQKDIEYLRREASRRPSRATGAPDPRAPRAPMTFEERLRAQLARDGLV